MKPKSSYQFIFLKLPVTIALVCFATVLVSLIATGRPGEVPTQATLRACSPNRAPFAPAGIVQQAWVSLYGGDHMPPCSGDSANAIAVDGSGNIYVTGGSCEVPTGNDYATIKYNSAGEEQWVARYDGGFGSDDVASAIAVDGTGNVYVTGRSSNGFNVNGYATIKYNSAGEEQWVARYGGALDGAYAIAVDGSGDVYVTGASYGGSTGFDYATIKYNSAGEEQWVARYDGGNGDDLAIAIAIDGTGDVYVTGKSTGAGTGYDYTTIKYNSTGEEQWVARYNGTGNSDDYASAMFVDGLGNVYVTGESTGAGTGFDYATIKYNSTGEEQWVARYDGGNGDDLASAMFVDGLGNVYVTGGSTGAGTGFDYTTIKYNSTGGEQWVARYDGGGGDDLASAMSVDGLGNVYVTGKSTGAGTGDDYATIKYNSTGEEQWVTRYSEPANDVANAIAIDSFRNVYVTGASVVSGIYTDYATIKYIQFTPTPTPTSTPRATPTPRVQPTARVRPTPGPRPSSQDSAFTCSSTKCCS